MLRLFFTARTISTDRGNAENFFRRVFSQNAAPRKIKLRRSSLQKKEMSSDSGSNSAEDVESPFELLARGLPTRERVMKDIIPPREEKIHSRLLFDKERNINTAELQQHLFEEGTAETAR